MCFIKILISLSILGFSWEKKKRWLKTEAAIDIFYSQHYSLLADGMSAKSYGLKFKIMS